MSLATRCTTCGTVFRVVQDQLRISEGWVRCGRCEAVFNALPTLFDLERDPPPPWPPVPPAEAELEAEPDLAAPEAPPEDDGLAQPDNSGLAQPSFTPEPGGQDSAADHPVFPQAPAEQPALPQGMEDEPAPPWTAAPDTHDWMAEPVVAAPLASAADPRPNTSPSQATAQWSAREAATAGRDEDPPLSAALADDELTITSYQPPPELAGSHSPPSAPATDTEAGASGFAFLREADRRARWQHPRMRAGLALGSVLAAVVLLLQTGLFFRNELAARSPLAASVLGGLCSSLGCRVGAPLDIESVTVESSSLSRIAANSEAVRLSLTLRNRAGTVVAMPAIDLNLTDGAGQLVARRALLPADFRVKSERLNPGSETSLQVVLDAGKQRVTGYSVELFYP